MKRILSASASGRSGKWHLFFLAMAIAMTGGTGSLAAATNFFVTNVGDTGQGSLRQAIQSANASAGTNFILFAIPAPGPFVISPVTPLPTIARAVVIDGYSQPGAVTNTLANGDNAVILIRLDGSLLPAGGDGLRVSGANCHIRGLALTGFGLPPPQVAAAIRLQGPGGGNVIEGNFIGLGEMGQPIPSLAAGIIIGGANPANNTLGGTTPAARNVISANMAGVIISAGANNRVQGNYIGTDLSGTQPMGNMDHGILITNTSAFPLNTVVGGLAPGAANTIAFNLGAGVMVASGTNHAVLGNSIYANESLAIDLGPPGPSMNDFGDADQGANNLQNFPILTAAITSNSTTTVTGTLSSAPNVSYRIEYFSNTNCSPTSLGEGRTFLGFSTVLTDAAGDVGFQMAFPFAVPNGHFVTATATDTNNNTSEFSPCVMAIPFDAADIVVSQKASSDFPRVGSNLIYTVMVSNGGPAPASSVVFSNALPDGVGFISALSSQGSCLQTGGMVTCDLGVMSVGGKASILIQVIPLAAGSITNGARAESPQFDSMPLNNVSRSILQVYQPSPPQITTPPEGGTYALGDDVPLLAGIGGSPPFQYQWRRNGVNIPGATNESYTILDFIFLKGGSYSLAVANDFGAVNSPGTVVKADLPDLPFTDEFSSQGFVQDLTGVGDAENSGANKEPGEPNHAGKPGGRSVWLSWLATASGIATFRTTGSSFDTLLAAYTGPSVSSLVEVASDEDRGTYLNSEISFNAVAGQVYRIAVDGFNGRSGNIVLSWNLENTPDLLPEIVQQPQSQTVPPGATVTFTVGTSLPGSAFQWFFNGQPLPPPGGTSNSLDLLNVQPSNLGSYTVQVSNGNRTNESRTAILQISSSAGGGVVQAPATSHKFPDLNLDPGSPPFFHAVKTSATKLRKASVARGYTGAQSFSTYGATKEEDEPNHCGIIGGASEWFAMLAETNGTMTINTDGSTFDTVLAVYTGPGTDYASLVPMGCDNNSGLDGLDSKVAFTATAGVIYFVAVDGVGGATGLSQLHYYLRMPVVLTATTLTNANCRFRVTGTPSLNTTVYGSSNLTTWTLLFTNSSPFGIFDYTDTNAPTRAYRFYKASQ